MSFIGAISLWNKGNIGMVPLFKHFALSKEIFYSLSLVIFDYIPIKFVEKASEAFWAWGFCRRSLCNCIRNFFYSGGLGERLIFHIGNFVWKEIFHIFRDFGIGSVEDILEMILKNMIYEGVIIRPISWPNFKTLNPVSSSLYNHGNMEKFHVKVRCSQPGDPRFLSLKDFFSFKQFLKIFF